MFTIEKGNPPPPPQRTGVCVGMAATLRRMVVGDSFLVPCEGWPAERRAITASISSFRRTHGQGWSQFVTRKVDGGVRVWRVK